MEMRKWNNKDIETSLLGFGCMRFPTLQNGCINEEEATQMLELAYAAGVNYYDTAYFYHDGASETFVGKWLNTKPRDSYYLTTKMPVMMIKSLDQAKEIFENQLKKLDKDYFDFYLLHALNKEAWDNSLKLGIIDYCEELLKEGKIRNFGFSFHDSYETFEEIIRYRKWDLCQIQYNYIDQYEQAGNRGYKLAEELGVPVVVMEPVKGGSLCNLTDNVVKDFRVIDKTSTLASLAYRWAGSHSNAAVILSGMSSLQQAKENIETFQHFKPLNEAEYKAIDSIITEIKKCVRNGCTGCRYCMPCPNGVNIPGNFSAWNEYAMYGNKGELNYKMSLLSDSEKAKNCINCGKCEKACPQQLHIRDDLKELQEELNPLLG